MNLSVLPLLVRTNFPGGKMRIWKSRRAWVCFGLAISIINVSAYSQDTTGGLQGTVRNPAGGVVVRARVIATGSTLIGQKESETDSSGYYRFTNLPPGTYDIKVTAEGFK